EHPQLRIQLEPAVLLVEPVWRRDVVGIHSRDERCTSDFQPLIQCCDQPGVLNANDPNTAVSRGVALQELIRSVGRAVVDADELEVGEGLAHDALYSLG